MIRSRTQNKAGGYSLILIMLLVVAGLYGWISNIVTVFHSSFDPITGAVVLRVVGIFIPPLGAVLGYF